MAQTFPEPKYPQAKSSAPQQQQPQAMAPMVPSGGNRNPLNLPEGSAGRPWSFSLYDCFGDTGTYDFTPLRRFLAPTKHSGLGCMSCWVPGVVFARNKRRLEHLNDHGTPDPHRDDFKSGNCCFYCSFDAVSDCGWALQISVRQSIRRRYNIEGGTFSDCMTAFWCTPCDLTQQSRELELEEKSLGAPGR